MDSAANREDSGKLAKSWQVAESVLPEATLWATGASRSFVEKFSQPSAEGVTVSRPAFPHNEHPPSIAMERSDMFAIPRGIALSLLIPILFIRGWRPFSAMTIVVVPEASMHENDLSTRG
jgi:hypothetical protein